MCLTNIACVQNKPSLEAVLCLVVLMVELLIRLRTKCGNTVKHLCNNPEVITKKQVCYRGHCKGIALVHCRAD